MKRKTSMKIKMKAEKSQKIHNIKQRVKRDVNEKAIAKDTEEEDVQGARDDDED